jgi:hypothetical protein
LHSLTEKGITKKQQKVLKIVILRYAVKGCKQWFNSTLSAIRSLKDWENKKQQHEPMKFGSAGKDLLAVVRSPQVP